jgi:Anti-sigma-K factor rskA
MNLGGDPNGNGNAKTQRLFALLCDAELVGLAGLSREEQAELAQLQREIPPEITRHEMQNVERAVAGLALMGGASRSREAMPPQLLARLEQQAMMPRSNVVPFAEKRPSRAPIVIAWIAAAACLVLAAGAIYKRPREIVVTKTVYVPSPSADSSQIQAPIASVAQVSSGAPVTSGTSIPSNAPPRTVSASNLREALLARVDTTTTPWSKTKDPASQNAGGDVVWNEALQQGFMRFAGLAKNDPTASQYQLWIFDDTRDAKYPVDGGVFDVDTATADPKTGDVIVPIAAKIKVGKPSLFAVTVEKPGGVVVSKRERIVLTAPGAVAKPDRAPDHKSPEKHG